MSTDIDGLEVVKVTAVDFLVWLVLVYWFFIAATHLYRIVRGPQTDNNTDNNTPAIIATKAE
jgi:hypothetical protein